MKQLIITIYFYLICAFCISQTANMTLRIEGVKESKGHMHIAIYNNAEDYSNSENYFLYESLAVTTQNFNHVFKNLPYGTYVVSLFHDLDTNDKLNTNWIGMPKEPFGFSNDARGRMGPPKFEDASFTVKKDLEIVVTLIEL